MKLLSSGQKIQSSVERMFRIWRDRKVYDKAFVKQLDQLLSGEKGGPAELDAKGVCEVSLSPQSRQKRQRLKQHHLLKCSLILRYLPYPLLY